MCLMALRELLCYTYATIRHPSAIHHLVDVQSSTETDAARDEYAHATQPTYVTL